MYNDPIITSTINKNNPNMIIILLKGSLIGVENATETTRLPSTPINAANIQVIWRSLEWIKLFTNWVRYSNSLNPFSVISFASLGFRLGLSRVPDGFIGQDRFESYPFSQNSSIEFIPNVPRV